MSKIADIINTLDEILLVFTEKIFFYFILFGRITEKGILKITFFLVINYAWLSAFSVYNVGCKHSLHLRNGFN